MKKEKMESPLRGRFLLFDTVISQARAFALSLVLGDAGPSALDV